MKATPTAIEGLLLTEADLLGALFLDGSLLAEVDGRLTPADLSDPGHAAILQGMLTAAARSEPLTVATVAGESVRQRELATRLLQQSLPMTPSDVRAVVTKLRARANRRRAHAALQTAAGDLAACEDDEVHRIVDGVLGNVLAATNPAEMLEASCATDLCAESFQATTQSTPPDAVPTGFLDFDFQISGGLHRGNVLTIGARTSVGKTAVAVALARHAAAAGAAVLYVSLEMSRAEIGDRLLAQVAGVSLRDLRARRLTPNELRRAADAQNQVRAWGGRLEVIDRGVRTVSALASLVRRRAVQRRSARVLVLDYAQLLRPGHGVSLREGYTTISRELKALARENNLSLVVLAQLRREAESRPDGTGRNLLRPALADLKETGAWEEDSDVVLLLWRDQVANIIRAELEKNRHGETGVTVRLGWHAASATPHSLAARELRLVEGRA